jgi:hypothetical protein
VTGRIPVVPRLLRLAVAILLVLGLVVAPGLQCLLGTSGR